MKFDILTIFPGFFDCDYLKYSILGRALKKKIIKIKVHDIRKYSKDKHRKVDDTPYGGGPGMVMMCQPLFDSIKTVKKKNKGPLIYLAPQGKILTHHRVLKLAELPEMILLCGRYEGIDQRVRDTLVDEEISIGKYVLTGGELPALVLIDAITRQLPGVLHDDQSALEDSFTRKLKGKKEYPHYTKPAVFRSLKVPEVLLTGHHRKIEKWRMKHLR